MWQVLAELSARLGDETEIDSAPEALKAIADEVPFYGRLTPEEIGGTGIRWQDRDQASGFPEIEPSTAAASEVRSHGDGLRLGTYRDLWAGEVTDRNVALQFLAPEQRVEIAPADAERLGLTDGDEVTVRSNGTALRARVQLRERIRPGSAFLIEGTATNNANLLNGAETVELEKL